MARVKRGVTARRRHKRLLNRAEGRRGTRSTLVRPAREALIHALVYAYRDRRDRKRDMRRLWIERINAASRQHGVPYGRFIAGLSGEQFALPEAVGALRAVRRRAHDGALLALSAIDPLNLVGTVLAGDKVPRQQGARVVYRDGLPLATLVAGEVAMLAPLDAPDEREVRRVLLREPDPQASSWTFDAGHPARLG